MKRLIQNCAPVALFALGLGLVLALTPPAHSASEEESVAQDAKTVYDKNCGKCHGKDGRSKTMRGWRTKARDISQAAWQEDVSDERIYNSIQNGRGKMPGFGKKLTEAQIDALVGYVRQLKK